MMMTTMMTMMMMKTKQRITGHLVQSKIIWTSIQLAQK
jgi:hypothetical protein